ncbi:MAG: RNA polymerase sigma factor [Pseudomonadota bacterium]
MKAIASKVSHNPIQALSDQADAVRWAQDAQCVEKARSEASAESHLAFAQLVERYQDYLRNMLFGLCRNQDLADELAQETFVTAWQKLDTLQEAVKFQGWIKQLAYRQFLHHQRHQKVVSAHLQHTRETANAELEIQEPDWQRLLKPCNELERELLVLLFGFEFTYAEISSLRGIPLGTVKSHVRRAKSKIAKMLEESS